MKGLVIKEPWIDMILDGKKTWEIRGSNTTIRGSIALIKSGTGMIYGTAELVDVVPLHGPDDFELILTTFDKHQVPLGAVSYLKPYAWVLKNPVKYAEPVPYKHPQGAVIWVNLKELEVRT